MKVLNLLLLFMVAILVVACSPKNIDVEVNDSTNQTGTENELDLEPPYPAASKVMADKYQTDIDSVDKFDGSNFNFLEAKQLLNGSEMAQLIDACELGECWEFIYSFEIDSENDPARKNAKMILTIKNEQILKVDFRR